MSSARLDSSRGDGSFEWMVVKKRKEKSRREEEPPLLPSRAVNSATLLERSAQQVEDSHCETRLWFHLSSQQRDVSPRPPSHAPPPFCFPRSLLGFTPTPPHTPSRASDLASVSFVPLSSSLYPPFLLPTLSPAPLSFIAPPSGPPKARLACEPRPGN